MKKRIATAIVLIGLAFALIWTSFWTQLALAGIIGFGILCETLKMANQKCKILSLIIFTCFITSLGFIHLELPNTFQLQSFQLVPSLLYLLTGLIVLVEFIKKRPIFVNNPTLFIARSSCIGMATTFSFLSIAVTAKETLFFFLILIWACDISALFIGKAIGKHKLSSFSPNKTIEGSLGGILVPMCITATLFMTSYAYLAVPKLILTLLVTVTAQISDIHESILKRFFNVKDSSQILPGHGGIYDRCDSYVLSLPTLALLLPHTLLPLLPL
jgi:phosphatidate cytidylyltransferase